MSTELIIAGEMGKGGGSTEYKDTLISEQTVKTLFVLGEGVIEGVQDIYLDTVSISNFDADYEVRPGTVIQSVIDNPTKNISFIDVESSLPGFTAKEIKRDSTKPNGQELPNVSMNITVSASGLIIGNWYRITDLGNMIWTLYGASKNEVGNVFKATHVATVSAGTAVQMEPNFQVPETIVSIPYETDMKSVRCAFTFSALSKTDGDGNIVGSTVQFQIYSRPSTSSLWTLLQSPTVKGKTTHGYTFDREIARPTTATSASPWQIKVIRITPDSGTVKKQDTMQWTAVTQLYHKGLTYGGSALAGVVLRDATQFGNRIPEIMFRVKGKKVYLPTNYDATARTYSGTWDGSFKLYTEYTNNPAWCLYDVLTDTRAGLGIPAADIDKYSFYNLSKYADEQFPNGFSDAVVCSDNGEVLQEAYPLYLPRFTLDYSFQTREGVKEFLSQILSLCNANLITNEFGQVSVIFQKPGQPVKRLVNNTNVIDGVFTYQSSNIEQRTNAVNVTYNRGLNFGRTDTVTVEDSSMIARYGRQPIDIVLPGCYHETQALRKARWTLYSNCYFTNFVSFSVFLDGMTYKIGDLIRVADSYNREDQHAGIILSSSKMVNSTTITLDRIVELASGTYTFFCYDINGNELTKTIVAPFSSDIITLSVAADVTLGALYNISAGATGKLYRVTSINKSEDQQYAITALEFDEAIFNYVDSGITLAPKTGDFAGVGQYSTVPVENVFVLENFGTNGIYTSGKLQVSWTWDTAKTQKYRANYKLTWSVDNSLPTVIDTITSDNFDIINPLPGVYTISVWAINPFSNFFSPVKTITYNFRTETASSTLLAPINLRIAGTPVVSPQPTTLTFATPELTLAFDYNPDNQNVTVTDALYDYLVEVWDSLGTAVVASYSINLTTGTSTVDPIDEYSNYTPLNGTFSLPFNTNVNIFGGTPARTFMVKVYSRDTLGDLSSPAIVTVSNPVPAFTDFSVTSDYDKVLIDITASSEIDAKNYIVYKGTTSNFVVDGTSVPIYRGAGNRVSIPTTDNNQYYYRCAISDSFGETGLNVSVAKGAASTSVSASMNRYTYSGLQFSTNKATNVVSWTSFTAYKETGTSEVINAGSATWTSGTLYLYYIPGNTALQSSNVATTAVSGRILASYKGGSDITADSGKAYLDGDQIVAGSLLANALATNVAYITGKAQFGNVLESDNYSATAPYAGWKIDKSGAATFTGLTIRSGSVDSTTTLAGTATSTVVSNAANAITLANSASANATIANNAITDISDDNKLTKDEKPELFIKWKAAYDERLDIIAKAASYSVSATGYSNAYTTLANYLTAAPISIDALPTTGGTWCGDATTISITGTTLRANFATYYSERQLLLNAIAAKAGTTAAWSGISSIPTTIENTNITISGGAINGIGSGNGTPVANSLISIITGNISGIGTGNGTTVANSAISIDGSGILQGTSAVNIPVANTAIAISSGNITGIGTGNGTTVANSSITVSAAGVLAGIGTSNVVVDNSKVTLASLGAAAAADLANKIDKSVNTVLSGAGAIIAGTLSIDSSGNRPTTNGGYGVAITSKGIVGYNSLGISTFSVDTTGNASFAGALSGATGTFAGSHTVGTAALSGTTMTGSGALINNSGTFCIGNASTNITFDGSTMYFNGQVVKTDNILANNVTDVTTYTFSYNSIPQPGSTSNASTTLTLLSNIVVPSVNISTKRILMLSFTLSHYDSTPGYIIVNIGGVSFTTDVGTRLTDGSNVTTYTAVRDIVVPANTTTISNITFTLQNCASTNYWNAALTPSISAGSLTIFTGKR